MFLAYTPTFAVLPQHITKSLPSIISNNLVLNGAFIGYITYSLYYIVLDPTVGLLYFPLLTILYLSSQLFYTVYGSQAWVYALALHILSWYMQIHVGHLIIEGRKPALMVCYNTSLNIVIVYSLCRQCY